MNYLTANVLEIDDFTITVKKKKDRYNIQISRQLLHTTEEIHRIIHQINEESVLGSFYFYDGTLTLQILLNEKLNEKSLKAKLITGIAAFESFERLLEVKRNEK